MPNRKAGAKSAKAVSTKTERPADLIEASSGSQSDDEAPSPGGSKVAGVKKQGKLPMRVKEHRRVNLEIPMSTPNGMSKSSRDADEEGDVFKTPMERRHITFDDSDHDEFVTPREAPLKNPLEEKSGDEEEGEDEDEEEHSDDDEAPEAISTHAAEAQTTKAAKAAAKAAEQQAASQRRKRQERDTFFKQQAEEKKRALEAAKADEKEGASTKDEAPEKRKRQIPKLLPLELLESDDEDDIPQRSDVNESSKRRKLAASEGLVREPKAPKDQKVGSTVFRVVADRGDQKLAPKRKKQSVNLKEDMLRRDRIPQQKRGFFVK